MAEEPIYQHYLINQIIYIDFQDIHWLILKPTLLEQLRVCEIHRTNLHIQKDFRICGTCYHSGEYDAIEVERNQESGEPVWVKWNPAAHTRIIRTLNHISGDTDKFDMLRADIIKLLERTNSEIEQLTEEMNDLACDRCDNVQSVVSANPLTISPKRINGAFTINLDTIEFYNKYFVRTLCVSDFVDICRIAELIRINPKMRQFLIDGLNLSTINQLIGKISGHYSLSVGLPIPRIYYCREKTMYEWMQNDIIPNIKLTYDTARDVETVLEFCIRTNLPTWPYDELTSALRTFI
jgi:hypothetical protein